MPCHNAFHLYRPVRQSFFYPQIHSRLPQMRSLRRSEILFFKKFETGHRKRYRAGILSSASVFTKEGLCYFIQTLKWSATDTILFPKRLATCDLAKHALAIPTHPPSLKSFAISCSFLWCVLRSPRWRNAFLTSRSSDPGRGNSQDQTDDREDGASTPSQEPDSVEDWLVPRTYLFVMMMFVIAGALWWLSQPRGRHVGWNYLNEHVSEIRSVDLYENYAQVYMTKGKVHVGLLNPADTQRHIEELRTNYLKVRRKTPSGTVGEGKTQKTCSPGEKHQNAEDPTVENTFACVLRGTPLSGKALGVLGVFAWVTPFVFFPVFVIILSHHIGKAISMAADLSKGKGNSKNMMFKLEVTSHTRFRDIAGMKEPKKEITEIVDFLRHPERYTKLGAKIPTGALLLGPPGTGKTLLAKAVAGESGVGFIPVCGSDFMELYVGMGALRVRQLFHEARKQRCIVYIDEIDAIGLKRRGAGHGEKQEQEQTLNELLTQLDGFSTGNRGEVMVLASSNVAQDALDPALIRPGRFDRIIHVDSPVISERIDIFKVHLSKLKLVSENTGDGRYRAGSAPTNSTELAEARVESSKECLPSPETQLTISALSSEKLRGDDLLKGTDSADFDFRALLQEKSDEERALIDGYAQRMSDLCPGFVGADIANVCNEAAILAAREGAGCVSLSHLERSIDRVLAGIEHRSRVLSAFEKTIVAHHEAGHAVVGWFLGRADPLMKVSIVPRAGSALGYAQYLPNENQIRTAREIRDSICVTLGGRVAEQIFFNHLSTGASDDLRKVTQLAYLFVTSFASGSVYPSPGSASTRIAKPFGSRKSDTYDVQAKALVDELYKETHELLLKHKVDMEKLAQHLLAHELLTHEDVLNYLGARAQRSKDKIQGV